MIEQKRLLGIFKTEVKAKCMDNFMYQQMFLMLILLEVKEIVNRGLLLKIKQY